MCDVANEAVRAPSVPNKARLSVQFQLQWGGSNDLQWIVGFTGSTYLDLQISR